MPTVTLSGDVEVCIGKSTTLTATASAGVQYTWSPITGDQSTLTVSPTVTTTYTVTVTDGNKCTAKDDHTISVKNCGFTMALGQGFYGTTNGTKCIAGQSGKTAAQIISDAFSNKGSDMKLGSTGKSFTATASQVANLVAIMPGGGTPATLAGNYTPGNVPLKNGRINNVLLSQTITMWININIKGNNLGTVVLNTVAGVPANVSSRVTNVVDLVDKASAALGGNIPTGMTLADINNALNAVVVAFDTQTAASEACSYINPSATRIPVSAVEEATINPALTASAISVKAYPNPYSDKIIFNINPKQTGKASLVLYNILGQKVVNVFEGEVKANTTQTIEYAVPSAQRSNLIFVFKNGTTTTTGKLMNGKK